MSQHFKRTDRVAAIIQRKLALIIPTGVRDPRLKSFVTISAVKVTADLGHAKVYFTIFDEDKKTAISILNAASGYLRSLLARSISLRTIPQLHFIYDESIEYGQRLSRLIDNVNSFPSNDTSDDNEDR
jgi:ribosome-binding factor A